MSLLCSQSLWRMWGSCQKFVRAAIVGAESLPNVFYEALKTFSQRQFPRFNTREEAMNWSVREET